MSHTPNSINSPPQGGYSLCLTTEQYEELLKYNVFAGINITYTMQNGNYVIRMTNDEYQIYLKNRQVAGPITSMQYNITMASGKVSRAVSFCAGSLRYDHESIESIHRFS